MLKSSGSGDVRLRQRFLDATVGNEPDDRHQNERPQDSQEPTKARNR